MRVQDRRGRARVVSRVGLGGLGYGDLSGLLGDDEGGDGRRGEERREGKRRDCHPSLSYGKNRGDRGQCYIDIYLYLYTLCLGS